MIERWAAFLQQERDALRRPRTAPEDTRGETENLTMGICCRITSLMPISIEPGDVPQNGFRTIRRVTGPEDVLPIIFTLDAIGWTELPYMAGGVHRRQGVDWDGVGFSYPIDAIRAGEEPFNSVEVHNPIFEVIVSERAFDRRMARFFQTLVLGAEKAKDPVIALDWWRNFVTIVEDVESRAPERSGGKPPSRGWRPTASYGGASRLTRSTMPSESGSCRGPGASSRCEPPTAWIFSSTIVRTRSSRSSHGAGCTRLPAGRGGRRHLRRAGHSGRIQAIVATPAIFCLETRE
jgi:hypothetical protein